MIHRKILIPDNICFNYEVRVESIPPLLRQFIGLMYQPWRIHGDDCEALSGMSEWQGKL
jgi:hypothetical protein